LGITLLLLSCDEGNFQKKHSTNEETSRVLKIGMRKIDRVKKRFIEECLDITLNGKKGSRIYAKKADGDFEAHLIVLSCSDPPEGFSGDLCGCRLIKLTAFLTKQYVRFKKMKLNLGAKKVG